MVSSQLMRLWVTGGECDTSGTAGPCPGGLRPWPLGRLPSGQFAGFCGLSRSRMVGMKLLQARVISRIIGFLAAGMLFTSPAFGQGVSISAVNNSLCFWSDTDNDQSTPVAYDPSSLSCVETGAADLNVFGVTAATTGNGTSAALFDVDAALVVDANPASSEYQAGRIVYALTVSITGTSGGAWDLTVDQQMLGLLTTVDDGAGVANASITGVTAALNLGPSLSFGTLTARSSGATGSTPFSASQAGDVIQGVGDTVLTGSLEELDLAIDVAATRELRSSRRNVA